MHSAMVWRTPKYIRILVAHIERVMVKRRIIVAHNAMTDHVLTTGSQPHEYVPENMREWALKD